MYSRNIITINGLNIMVTLVNVYFEYIRILCKIFIKYIVPILQVYPSHLIIVLKIITNDIYYYLYYYLYYIFILFTCNKHLNFNSNILLHNDDDDIKMIGKIII